MEGYRKTLFAGITIIALGIVFTTTLSKYSGSLGVVLIAVGGLFFIAGMNEKRKVDREEKSDS